MTWSKIVVKARNYAAQLETEKVWEYLDSHPILSNASKTGGAVSGSYQNCRNNAGCGEFCYASKGRCAFPNSVKKTEIVSHAINDNPLRAAEQIAVEYHKRPLYKNGEALRFFDRGDMNEKYIDVIKTLNIKDIRCHLFSKRPEYLEQIDQSKNVISLSIDSVNYKLADKHPTLPLAIVYDGSDKMAQIVSDNESRFAERGGVILPLVNGDKHLSAEELAKLPQWSAPYVCPIDAGYKKVWANISKPMEHNEWRCPLCDRAGIGCFYGRGMH